MPNHLKHTFDINDERQDHQSFHGDPYHFEILKVAIDSNNIAIWNSWIKKNNRSRINLQGAFLSFLDLSGIVLLNVDLSFADLSFSCLENAFIQNTSFYKANLHGATLINSSLENTDLSQVTQGSIVYYN